MLFRSWSAISWGCQYLDALLFTLRFNVMSRTSIEQKRKNKEKKEEGKCGHFYVLGATQVESGFKPSRSENVVAGRCWNTWWEGVVEELCLKVVMTLVCVLCTLLSNGQWLQWLLVLVQSVDHKKPSRRSSASSHWGYRGICCLCSSNADPGDLTDWDAYHLSSVKSLCHWGCSHFRGGWRRDLHRWCCHSGA